MRLILCSSDHNHHMSSLISHYINQYYTHTHTHTHIHTAMHHLSLIVIAHLFSMEDIIMHAQLEGKEGEENDTQRGFVHGRIDEIESLFLRCFGIRIIRDTDDEGQFCHPFSYEWRNKASVYPMRS